MAEAGSATAPSACVARPACRRYSFSGLATTPVCSVMMP